jgi:long-chain acyl-CoA synthetase
MLTDEINTLPKLLRTRCQKYGSHKVAMRKKILGIWHEYTWKEVYDHVERTSLGLVSIGLKPLDVVAIAGDSDPEWFWAEYAIQAAQGIPVGLYVDAHFTEVKYLLAHSEARFIFAKDQEQIDKVLQIKEGLPQLEKIIFWDPRGLWDYDLPFLISWEKLEQEGERLKQAHQLAFDVNIDAVKGNDVAVLCYTSGTTRATEDGISKQKGVMLSHNFLIENARAWQSVDPWYDSDVWLSFVPPAWGTEQITGIAGCLLAGTEVNFPEKPETVTENIREVGPQILFLGARLWENYAATVQAKNNDTTRLKRFLFNNFLRVGYKVADLKFHKKKPSLIVRALYRLGDYMVFAPLRDKLGLLRLRAGYQGGATLSSDNMRFFHAIGVDLRQVYGLTEAGLQTVHRSDDIDPETVGKPLKPEWMKISPEGEILTGGSLKCNGYFKDPEATKELIDPDGWLHTGDAGYINESGHLVYYDRLKEMVRLPSGRQFAPSYIEGKLRFSPYIKDCVVIGGMDKPFVSALININFDNIGNWAQSNRVVYTTFVDLSQKDEVYNLIKKDVDRVNRYLLDETRIKRFVNLHKEFDPDEAELTRSRKVRKKFVENKYQELLDAIYSGKDAYEIEAAVKYRDGRTGVLKTAIKIKNVEG